MKTEHEATRYIGSAEIHLSYDRDEWHGGSKRPIYRGEVLAGGHRWKFDDIGGQAYARDSLAVDSPETFDQIASSAVTFGIHEGGDVGDAIDEATRSASEPTGYDIRRRPAQARRVRSNPYTSDLYDLYSAIIGEFIGGTITGIEGKMHSLLATDVPLEDIEATWRIAKMHVDAVASDFTANLMRSLDNLVPAMRERLERQEPRDNPRARRTRRNPDEARLALDRLLYDLISVHAYGKTESWENGTWRDIHILNDIEKAIGDHASVEEIQEIWNVAKTAAETSAAGKVARIIESYQEVLPSMMQMFEKRDNPNGGSVLTAQRSGSMNWLVSMLVDMNGGETRAWGSYRPDASGHFYRSQTKAGAMLSFVSDDGRTVELRFLDPGRARDMGGEWAVRLDWNGRWKLQGDPEEIREKLQPMLAGIRGPRPYELLQNPEAGVQLSRSVQDLMDKVGGQRVRTWPLGPMARGEEYFQVSLEPDRTAHVRIDPSIPELEIQVLSPHPEDAGVLVQRSRDPANLMATLQSVITKKRANPIRRHSGKIHPVPVHLREVKDVSSGMTSFEIAHEGSRYPVSSRVANLVDAFRSREILIVMSVEPNEEALAFDLIDVQQKTRIGGIVLNIPMFMMLSGLQSTKMTKDEDMARLAMNLMSMLPGEN